MYAFYPIEKQFQVLIIMAVSFTKCVSCCCRILRIPTEELQHHFDTQLPESVKELLTYARNFLEFCSYQALHVVSSRPDYLSDKEFRHLTFDMMLAWESPCAENNKELNKVRIFFKDNRASLVPKIQLQV